MSGEEVENMNQNDNPSGTNLDESAFKSDTQVSGAAGGLDSENQEKVRELLADVEAVLSGPKSDREIFEFNDVCKRLALLSGRGRPPVLINTVQAGPSHPFDEEKKEVGNTDNNKLPDEKILKNKTGTRPKFSRASKYKSSDSSSEEETKTSSRRSGSSKTSSRRRVRRRRSEVRGRNLPKIESVSSENDCAATPGKDKSKPKLEITEKNMVDCLAKAMGATRKIPEPKVFDVQSKRKWDVFLAQFEKYCTSQYSDDKEDWAEILEKFLEGEVKIMYQCLQSEEQSYEKMIKKLTKWVKGKVDSLDLDHVGVFHEAQMKEGESCYMYASRLEILANKAYPGDKKTVHKQLRRKFLKTIPEGWILSQIEYQDLLNRRMTGHKMSWKEIREQVLMMAGKESKVPELTLGPQPPECLMFTSTALENTVPAQGQNDPNQKKNTRRKKKQKNNAANPNFPQTLPNTSQMQNTCQPDPAQTQAAWPANSSQRQNGGQSNSRPGNAVPTPAGNTGNSQSSARSENVSTPSGASVNTGPTMCTYCGKMGHHESNCWSKNTTCYVCGGPNHIAKYCMRNRSFMNRGRGRGRGRGGFSQYGNRSEFSTNTPSNNFMNGSGNNNNNVTERNAGTTGAYNSSNSPATQSGTSAQQPQSQSF